MPLQLSVQMGTEEAPLHVTMKGGCDDQPYVYTPPHLTASVITPGPEVMNTSKGVSHSLAWGLFAGGVTTT